MIRENTRNMTWFSSQAAIASRKNNAPGGDRHKEEEEEAETETQLEVFPFEISALLSTRTLISSQALNEDHE